VLGVGRIFKHGAELMLGIAVKDAENGQRVKGGCGEACEVITPISCHVHTAGSGQISYPALVGSWITSIVSQAVFKVGAFGGMRSWQEIGGLCSHTSQLEKPLIFLGLIGFNAKLGHWQDMPLVCDFCPGLSGTQAAPMNAGLGGLGFPL
jgi:hypothetical protein